MSIMVAWLHVNPHDLHFQYFQVFWYLVDVHSLTLKVGLSTIDQMCTNHRSNECRPITSVKYRPIVSVCKVSAKCW